MKNLFLVLVLSIVSFNVSAQEVQKFKNTSLYSWVFGPGDWANLYFKHSCDQADQALAKQSAEEAAMDDCNSAPGIRECLVKSSRIIYNTGSGVSLPADILSKYGKADYDMYGFKGCEAEALVYGLE